jgi:hypothetical protein
LQYLIEIILEESQKKNYANKYLIILRYFYKICDMRKKKKNNNFILYLRRPMKFSTFDTMSRDSKDLGTDTHDRIESFKGLQMLEKEWTVKWSSLRGI